MTAYRDPPATPGLLVCAGLDPSGGAGLIADVDDISAAAERRRADPAYLPDSGRESSYDETLASVAATVSSSGRNVSPAAVARLVSTSWR